MSDEFKRRANNIYELLIRNGHTNSWRLLKNDLTDTIRRRGSVMAFYIASCNEFGIKHDKKTSLSLIKFDLKNGLTYTTCLAECLFFLPDNRCLKVH